MSLPVLLRRAAELDLAEIEDWYETQREGLGSEFRVSLDEVIRRISDNPFICPERYRGNRRALLRRFPYVVWYRADGDRIVVLACIHGRRDPRRLRARLREGG